MAQLSRAEFHQLRDRSSVEDLKSLLAVLAADGEISLASEAKDDAEAQSERNVNVGSDRPDPKYRGLFAEESDEEKELHLRAQEESLEAARSFLEVPVVEEEDEDRDNQNAHAASPAAEALAADEGVDLHDVDGSGADGRVLVSDVEAAADEA